MLGAQNLAPGLSLSLFPASLQCRERRLESPSTFSIMTDGSAPRIGGKGKSKSTFNTLEREESFKYPTKQGSTVPILNEFVQPAIESFNALFDDSGLPEGDTDGKGLLTTSLKDIGERVVFDGHGIEGEETGQTGWGNRMRST
jgi:hypothetical protein